jgi:N-acetylmuramoyl-L-alanine amidase
MEPFGLGHVGPEVEDVQRRLEDLGFACPGEPGIFDEATRSAVRGFQQRRGLAADGWVGDDTWRALLGASLRLGDRLLYVTRPVMHGDDVQELQRRLTRLGFDAGYEDGLYGPQTFDAVREFQLNTGLDVDGIAGPATVDLLKRLHRRHQVASVVAVREREVLRHPTRLSIAGARVMVDPGHCAAEPGLAGPDGSREHEVTWQIASLVEGQLAALGAHVVLSRGPASSPTPSERAGHANAEDVEAIVSIHLDGHPSRLARGAAGFYFGTALDVSDRGHMLAELAIDRIVELTGTPHCRVHPATTAILLESRAPAVIVAPGYLTHPEEGRALLDPGYQRLIATGLTDALVTFLVGAPARAPRPVPQPVA